MCVLSDKEYPSIPPVQPVTHQQMVLMLIGPMSRAGTLPAEAIQANIRQAMALKHHIEAVTGHTVVVPQLELLHLPPDNGKPGWQLLFERQSHLLQAKIDGIFQLPYDSEQDVECVALIGWWHRARASIRIYRALNQIPTRIALTI